LQVVAVVFGAATSGQQKTRAALRFGSLLARRRGVWRRSRRRRGGVVPMPGDGRAAPTGASSGYRADLPPRANRALQQKTPQKGGKKWLDGHGPPDL